MKTKIILTLLLMWSLPSSGQPVDVAWVARYEGVGDDYDVAVAITVDQHGNVYVAGSSNQSPYPDLNNDFVTIKYLADGTLAWARTYDGPGHYSDRAEDVAIDLSGNVYVTGTSWGGNETEEDFATVKYSAAGDTLWIRRYGSPFGWSCSNWDCDDYAHALTVDDEENVYVTGSVLRWEPDPGWTESEFVTLMYGPDGILEWVAAFPLDGGDWGSDVALDQLGNILVTGTHWRNYEDFATMKLDSDAFPMWWQTFNGPARRTDVATALVVDHEGNVLVTGKTAQDSTSYPYRFDYATVKYGPDGTESWVRTYDGPGNGDDIPSDIGVDDSGNVYVTGTSTGSGTGPDYATVKYSPAGDLLWVRRYDGEDGHLIGSDQAEAIAVDDSGSVYVTGYSYDSYGWNGMDFATIKYRSNGDVAWVMRYNGEAASYSEDYALAVAVDDSQNVCVTGRSYGEPMPGSNYDCLTIKYSQPGEQMTHDIAVADLALVEANIERGEPAGIHVLIENQGDLAETFDVEVTAAGGFADSFDVWDYQCAWKLYYATQGDSGVAVSDGMLHVTNTAGLDLVQLRCWGRRMARRVCRQRGIREHRTRRQPSGRHVVHPEVPRELGQFQCFQGRCAPGREGLGTTGRWSEYREPHLVIRLQRTG